MIEKQSEYLQKLPIEPTVANPVYSNGQTEETKHVEEASSSVCLDDEELEMFVDQQKNCNSKKKIISNLRKLYGWCESVGECRKIGKIPPTELDRLLGHFFCNLSNSVGGIFPIFLHFCIHSTPDGFKYVEFNERDTKTRSGDTNASRQFKP